MTAFRGFCLIGHGIDYITAAATFVGFWNIPEQQDDNFLFYYALVIMGFITSVSLIFGIPRLSDTPPDDSDYPDQ